MSTMKKQELNVEETLSLQTKVRPSDPSSSPQATVPTICDFRGIREIVMKQTWEDADTLAARGVPLTSDLMGALIRRNWGKAKELARQQCRPVSPEEINKLLGQ